MATGKSKSSSTRFKCLSTVNLGGNEIRFVGMNEETSIVHFPKDVRHCPGRLLFVSSDVMRSSKISRKNFTRVITRFSKIGFAVKMRLSGFKIDGINNGGVIWFFSIQGLFRVAFNLGNMAFQKDCLSELQEVWLQRYSDPLLPSDGVLKFNKRFREIPDDSVLSSENRTVNKELENEVRMFKGRACPSTCIVIANENWTLPNSIEDYQGEEVYTERMCSCVGDCYCSPGLTSGKLSSESDGNNFKTRSRESETACSLKFNTCSTYHRQNCKPCIGTFRQKLLNFIHVTCLEDVSSPFATNLILVFDYIHYFLSSQKTDSFQNFGCFLFKIMEEFLLLVNTEDDLPDMSKTTCGMSQERFILMHLISDWLGKEFHDLEGVIKENVDRFKKDNITCIDSLPSAETITKTLFPSFMRIFVLNWLGFQNEDLVVDQDSEGVLMSDHCYTQSPKIKGQSSVNYQLIQLILEFGSNCLISGIGHVVFSRLQIENNSDL